MLILLNCKELSSWPMQKKLICPFYEKLCWEKPFVTLVKTTDKLWNSGHDIFWRWLDRQRVQSTAFVIPCLSKNHKIVFILKLPLKPENLWFKFRDFSVERIWVKFSPGPTFFVIQSYRGKKDEIKTEPSQLRLSRYLGWNHSHLVSAIAWIGWRDHLLDLQEHTPGMFTPLSFIDIIDYHLLPLFWRWDQSYLKRSNHMD